MSNIAALYAAQIQQELEAWRAYEMDYVTLVTSQQDIWAAVRAAGREVEDEVVATLSTAATQKGNHPSAYGLRRVAFGAPAPRATPDPAKSGASRHYHARIVLSEPGSLALRIAAADPNGPCSAARNMAAFIYEMAADLERQSLRAGAQWNIVTDPYDYQIVIQLEGDHETALAFELLENLITRYALIDAR